MKLTKFWCVLLNGVCFFKIMDNGMRHVLLGNYWSLNTIIAGRWSLPELEQLRYNNREHHQSQLCSKRRLMCIPDVKCDEFDQMLMCMADWCFAILKWWMMGCDISCLATTGNFIMVAFALVLVTGSTYHKYWCICCDAALLGVVFQMSKWAIHLREDMLQNMFGR